MSWNRGLYKHKLTLKQLETALKEHGSQQKAADALGIPGSTFKAMRRALGGSPAAGGSKRLFKKESVRLPRRGHAKRFIFTSAQDNTAVDAPFWKNLLAYADHIGAVVKVAGFTYTTRDRSDVTYAAEVQPYLTNRQIDVGGKLLFCSEINNAPTSAHPLSGFETYTRDKWGVFPHPRVELRSIATMFHAPAKQIMTTGAVTRPHYINRKAGIKAEFHHVIGALLVELDGDGDVFCRHLIASDNGSFYDLDVFVDGGRVTKSPGVEAITWGDIHAEQIDPVVRTSCWGAGGVVDALRPAYQFFHDAQDFTARNHHSIRDPYHLFKAHCANAEDVSKGLDRVAAFLDEAYRAGAESVVVESNHDLMLRRWLKEADYRFDPVNAVFFLEAQREMYLRIQAGEDDFSPFKWALEKRLKYPVKFLGESDSFKICNDKRRGIECALHGHRGANGAKGHISSFARMGSKANVCHTHSPAIHEGIYQAGTSSKLDLGYNRGGLSSWGHAHIVTYRNAKRIILTMQGRKWRAAP